MQQLAVDAKRRQQVKKRVPVTAGNGRCRMNRSLRSLMLFVDCLLLWLMALLSHRSFWRQPTYFVIPYR